MKTAPAFIGLACLAALAACGPTGAPQSQGNRQAQAEPEPETIEIPQTVTQVAPGTTPMAQRTAVLGVLNKRNGISRDITLRPGQAVRLDDIIVRLRACETTAPWEEQRLTGAFVQVDVRNLQGQFNRIFSGWLYGESPSLNVVEHPVYDVWPKSCAMTHPDGASEPEGNPASNRSSAPNSAGAAPPRRARPEPAPEEPRAEVSNST
jgi:hypothetical protein